MTQDSSRGQDDLLEQIEVPDSPEVPSEPDGFAEGAVRGFENEERVFALDTKKSDAKDRKAYLIRVFRLLVVWLGVVMALVIVDGIESIPFTIPNSVEVALVTTTTASVVGLFAIAMNYLFKKN